MNERYLTAVAVVGAQAGCGTTALIAVLARRARNGGDRNRWMPAY